MKMDKSIKQAKGSLSPFGSCKKKPGTNECQRDKDGLKILRARAKDFFGYPGSITCYKNLKKKELIPIPWMDFIDDALMS